MDSNSAKARLTQHYRQCQRYTLVDLFRQDPARAKYFSLEAAGLYLDYSKNHLNQETLQLLTERAREAKLPQAISDLVNGEAVNNTERRPALHTSLRFQGAPQTPQQQLVTSTLERMEQLVTQLQQQQWLGFNGQAIRHVVNIGIGGSDLGPRMMTDALTAFHQSELKLHFVANIDGAAIGDVINNVDPARTLFIVASKSFSTLETLENAKTARQWLLNNGCSPQQLCQHFIAITAKPDKATAFGINAQNILPMWDWVGGRYSLWSAIGLPIALAVGMGHFRALLRGANAMDQHFIAAPLDQNMPVILALISYWYSQLWGSRTHAVLPYSHHMHYFPEFLQQLEMESLGKRVDRDGNPLNQRTGSIIWGSEGSNGQHSFHQLLHQSNHLVPIDFITTLNSDYSNPRQQQQLFACCISQSQALLSGKPLNQVEQELQSKGLAEDEIQSLAPHLVIPGNRPSSTLILEELTPYRMGALTALYEHKVYALSVLLNINAFDQWGVELGKQLGTEIFTALDSKLIPSTWDSSTSALVKRFIDHKGQD